MVVISIFSRINYMSRNNLRIVVCMHHGPMTPIWIHEYVFFKRQSAYLWVQTAPLLADLLLYSYETNFIQGLLKKYEQMLARSFNHTFRYIDDVLSLDNSRFGDFVDRIYPIELDIKDNTYTERFALYLNLHLEIDSEGRLRMQLRQKRWFQFSHWELSFHM